MSLFVKGIVVFVVKIPCKSTKKQNRGIFCLFKTTVHHRKMKVSKCPKIMTQNFRKIRTAIRTIDTKVKNQRFSLIKIIIMIIIILIIVMIITIIIIIIAELAVSQVDPRVGLDRIVLTRSGNSFF